MKYIKRFESNSDLDKDIDFIKDVFQDVIDDYDIYYLDSEVAVDDVENGSYYKIYKNKAGENADILLRFIFRGQPYNKKLIIGSNGFEEEKINPNIEKLKSYGYEVRKDKHGGERNSFLSILINVPDNTL